MVDVEEVGSKMQSQMCLHAEPEDDAADLPLLVLFDRASRLHALASSSALDQFDLPLLDYKMRFALWQVKMRAILAQSLDLDEALDGFGGKGQKSWTAEEKRKDHTILLSRDELTLAEVYEALQTREKMKGMVQSDVSSSKGEVLQSGDVVRMGDNNPHEIMGIGSIQIKMHDGMIRTLKDMRHIPGMDRNLISLSTLDAEGYRHSGLGGVCKVSKGSLIHMIGDMNSTKLYVLRGSTLHGSVTAATVSNDEPNKTNLCHMRLGHMSELGMAELIKRDLLDGCTVGKIKFYEHSVFGKHKRVKFNVSVHTTKEWKVMIERQTEKKLRVFGCTAYAHVDNGKLEPRAIKCLFLGYGYGVKGYKLWNPKTKKTFMSRNVVFNDSVMFNDSLSTDVSPVGSDEEQEHVSVQVEHVDDQETKIVDNNVHDIVQHSPPVLQPQNQSIADRRTKRSCRPRPRLIEECDIVHYAFSCAEQVENIHEPATYTEVVVSGDREKWIAAMQEEMQSLEKNDTWDVVCLPKHKKVIHCKWIFKRKEGLSPTLQCASTDEDFEYMSRVPYSSVVGSLMYAMVCFCPDLSYVMTLVSRYMANPDKEHWKVVQWIFRYLRGTTNVYLKFGRTDKGLTGYVDSDFATDLDKRRSLTGYVFTIGGCA
ncbi:unnamed protein product [Miscanthus lutarioriparius]|uniref:Uncharacterized protein n=1 Tax=Miscanthus lutarioriparius TaxID=422564 RepID=A0A811PIM8_9POAL|nr:unnamed protein product [Miscanthus lutarioriparius]